MIYIIIDIFAKNYRLSFVAKIDCRQPTTEVWQYYIATTAIIKINSKGFDKSMLYKHFIL